MENLRTKEDVCQYIIDQLRKVVEKGSSLSQISYRSGCSGTTIDRVYKGNVKSLSSHNAFSLLCYLKGKNTALEIMDTAYPRWHRNFRQAFKDTNFISLDKIDWDEQSIWILDMSCNDCGISEEEIIDRFGRVNGLEKANLLCDIGAIKRSENRYIGCRDWSDQNISSVKSRMEVDLKYLKLDKIDDGVFYSRKTRFYTEEGAKKRKLALQKYFIEIASIDENEEKLTMPKNFLVKECIFGENQIGEPI